MLNKWGNGKGGKKMRGNLKRRKGKWGIERK